MRQKHGCGVDEGEARDEEQGHHQNQCHYRTFLTQQVFHQSMVVHRRLYRYFGRFSKTSFATGSAEKTFGQPA
jgi:hypothetical protein